MSFFTSFQELLDFDQSTNLNGFHFSNSLFGFDSNSIPGLENLPPPPPTPTLPVDQHHHPTTTPAPVTTNCRRLLKTPSPVPEPTPLLETPKQCQIIQQIQHAPQTLVPPSPVPLPPTPTSNPQVSPIPIVSKFQLKVTPNNEIYISNESGTFCELAGSFVPSTAERGSCAVPIVETIMPPASPELIEPEPEDLDPPKTLYCIERGIKRPLSPSDHRYCNSGIFRSLEPHRTPPKKKTTSTKSNGLLPNGPEPESAAKLVVSNVINNGLIVNKKHLSNSDEQPNAPASSTPERRIMRPKKKKKKPAPKVTLEAKIEPVNGRIMARIAPAPTITVTSRKVPQQSAGKRSGPVPDNLRKVPIKPTPAPSPSTAAAATPPESTLNFSGIKEKAAQEAIFTERVEKPTGFRKPQPQQQPQPVPKQVPHPVQHQNHVVTVTAQPVQTPAQPKHKVPVIVEPDTKLAPDGAAIPDEAHSSPAPVELKVVADLVMDKDVFGHISLLSNDKDRNKAVIYQNPVTTKNVIYSILNPKSLNLSLGGTGRGTTATLTLQPHVPGRKPKKRGRKKKVPGDANVSAKNGLTNGLGSLAPTPPDLSALDPNTPVMITRSGRLSKPPRYANNFFQNMKQKPEPTPVLPPPPPPPAPVIPRLDLPSTDPETIEKLPNFSAALTSSAVAPAAVQPEQQEPKRKMKIPLQYRCATCNKIYLGKRMQRHLEKYPSHNSQRDCMEPSKEKVEEKEEEKSTYLYKHLFDLLQKFTEKDKGRIMLKEISHFVDYVRALIPKLITNDEQHSTVEYIDHNVADVLRLNHGKYRLKISSLAEECDKLNLTVNLLNNNPCTPSRPPAPLSTSTPNGTIERHSLSFNADDLLNQSSSFPSLTTLMHEHNLLLQQNGNVGAIYNNNNNSFHQQNNNHQPQQQINSNHQHPSNHHHHHHHHHHLHHSNNNNNNNNHHHYSSSNHHHHLPLIGSSCHDDAMNSLSGLCKSPVQHSTSGMVNMALNLY
ncbi:proteoglycan 4 [Aedes albopictus]|uniref:Serine/threonine-protein kinase fhkb n=1 Tax=Aedes albopictus TaxID=7160 RepID=A0ABM1ZJ80_AEDAL|nr:proteoglycan 4-like [Aedes albopictus]